MTVGATQTDITLLGQGLRNAITVDYDQMNHILFWADITQDKIQRVKLDGSKYYLPIYKFISFVVDLRSHQFSSYRCSKCLIVLKSFKRLL